MSEAYYVYWIRSNNKHYIGATVCPQRRLRQHNGEIQGGAQRTTSRGPWTFECVIKGFRTWKEALQFEWAFKFYTKRCRGVDSRKQGLQVLLGKDRWTSNAPLASEIILDVEFNPTQYGMPSEKSIKCMETSGAYKDISERTKRRKCRFKKIHGVSY